MKIINYPYLVIDSSWGSTMNIFNSGFNSEKVKICFRRGQRKEELNILITPNNRYNITELEIQNTIGISSDPLSISILCNNEIAIMCGMYFKGSSGMDFFNIMPENIMVENIECLYSGNGFEFDVAENNFLYKFYGSLDGKYLEYKTGCVFDYILSKDSLKNTNPLVVGDCCRNDALNLDGHPDGSHTGLLSGGGRAADINYPRYDGQYTHYRPDGAVVAPIFGADGSLLTNFFNHKRFYNLICDINIYFPDCIIRVDQRIKTFLDSEYGALGFVQGDPINAYSHNMHSHISFGTRINI